MVHVTRRVLCVDDDAAQDEGEMRVVAGEPYGVVGDAGMAQCDAQAYQCGGDDETETHDEN